jgi:hypothetical protein
LVNTFEVTSACSPFDDASFLFTRLGKLEAVAGAAHRFQVARILRIDLDLLTDAAHINVDRTRSDEAGIAPDGVEQVVAAEDPAGMARQVVQQPELGGRGGGQLAAHLQLHGVGVDDDLFKADDRGRGGPLKAAQHGLDAGHQFARGKGLGDVVVGAQFQAQHAVVFAGARGQKDDGNGGQPGWLRRRRQTSRPSPPGTMMSSRNSAGAWRSASGIRLVGV